MKFRIVQTKQEEKLEPITKLELRYDDVSEGGVDVVAIDEDENERYIISFLSTGKLFLYTSIGDNNGFIRNKNGQIIVCK